MKILVNCLEVDMQKTITEALLEHIPDVEIVNVGTEGHCDHKKPLVVFGDINLIGFDHNLVPNLEGVPLGALNCIYSGRCVGKSQTKKLYLDYLKELSKLQQPKQKPEKGWYRKLEKTNKRKHYKIK